MDLRITGSTKPIPSIHCKIRKDPAEDRGSRRRYVPDRTDRDVPSSLPPDPRPDTNQNPSPREPIFDRRYLL